MVTKFKECTDSVAWNLFLLVLGGFVYVVGYNGVAAHHDFVPGTSYGFAVVLEKNLPVFSLSVWYFLINIPMFVAAWKGVSKRFFFLNLITMVAVTLMTAYVDLDLGIKNEMYAAIVAGAIMGAGCGMIFRSYGGGGGLDVVAVILNRKFGVKIGAFYFIINLCVMLSALSRYTPDKLIASLVMIFICSVVTEYVLSLFNQRKAVRIVTKKTDELVKMMMEKKHHVTVFQGRGGYTDEDVDMIFSISDNIRLRSLEQLVFDCDPEAIFVVENTFSVIGGTFARRKVY